MKNTILILLAMVFAFSISGCDELEDLWHEEIAHDETPEEYLARTQERAWSDGSYNMEWFQVRGFNLQFKHVAYREIDEETDRVIVNEIRDDMGINFADQMIVQQGDIITVCNLKLLGEASTV